MTNGVAPLAIPATLQLAECDVDVDVTIDHTYADGQVVIGAVRLNGAEIELKQVDIDRLRDMLAGLYEDGGQASE